MTAPQAPCRLCGNTRELRASHIIPAWCYERAKHDAEGRVPQLILYDGFAGTTAYTNKEMKEHLLCGQCEQDFSSGFESYVSRVAVQEAGSFPALSSVTAPDNKRIVSRDGRHTLCTTGSLDVDKLARFALSVVWRASVSANRYADGVRLGTHEQSVADYLLRRAELSESVSVCMRLVTSSQLQHAIFPPFSKRFAGGWMHQFLVNGLYFTVHVGQRVERPYRDLCITRGRWVALDDAENMVALFAEDLRAATPKGKLAREG